MFVIRFTIVFNLLQIRITIICNRLQTSMPSFVVNYKSVFPLPPSTATMYRASLSLTQTSHSSLSSAVPASSTEPMTIDLYDENFHTYNCDAPSLQVSLSKDELLDIYKKMFAMRRMESSADQLYKQKYIRGFCHLAIGQEAVSVGMEHGMDTNDKLITAYRCHPFAVMRGGTIKGVIAELLGRQDGMSHGKGGSMHIFTPTFFGGNGIVGAQVPVGTGIAFGLKYANETNHACFTLYGDGAANQGQVFESFNMAKLWNLPCVFTCENNQYGMGTSADRASANTKYFTRGDTIPGLQVNAMDVLAVLRATQYAKEWATAGKGPLLLEMVTYRYGGHSMSDPGTTYRSREEIQDMRARNDPINGLKMRLLDWGVVSENELRKLEKTTREEVETEVEEAKNAPLPDIERDMWTDVYFKGTAPPFMRGREKEEIHWYKNEEAQGAPAREVKITAPHAG